MYNVTRRGTLEEMKRQVAREEIHGYDKTNLHVSSVARYRANDNSASSNLLAPVSEGPSLMAKTKAEQGKKPAKEKLTAEERKQRDLEDTEKIIPASDVSEQISTAGKEASGTGNMKFMMNGALTLGTLDGANVEIADLVGVDHCVIFGMKVDQVQALYHDRTYSAWDMYHQDPTIKWIIDSLIDGTWSEGHADTFRVIFDEMMHRNDEYFLLKDFASYCKAHDEVSRRYQNRQAWLKSMIINIAQSGFFSTDRTIQQYIDEIWKIHKII
jgi:hypothetical protein